MVKPRAPRNDVISFLEPDLRTEHKNKQTCHCERPKAAKQSQWSQNKSLKCLFVHITFGLLRHPDGFLAMTGGDVIASPTRNPSMALFQLDLFRFRFSTG